MNSFESVAAHAPKTLLSVCQKKWSKFTRDAPGLISPILAESGKAAPSYKINPKIWPEGFCPLTERVTISNASITPRATFKMAAAVGNAPTYQVLQTCANLSQLSSEISG